MSWEATTDMKEFLHRALRLTDRWSVTDLSVDHQNKKVQIEVSYSTLGMPADVEVGAAETVRHLSILDYQTFITSPVIWSIGGSRREKLPLPWADGTLRAARLS